MTKIRSPCDNSEKKSPNAKQSSNRIQKRPTKLLQIAACDQPRPESKLKPGLQASTTFPVSASGTTTQKNCVSGAINLKLRSNQKNQSKTAISNQSSKQSKASIKLSQQVTVKQNKDVREAPLNLKGDGLREIDASMHVVEQNSPKKFDDNRPLALQLPATPLKSNVQKTPNKNHATGHKKQSRAESPQQLAQSPKKRSILRSQQQRLPMQQNEFEFVEYGNKAYCSNHVINFKIVETEADLVTDEKPFFRPKFTHQLFNLDETVRGHAQPSIEVFLSASSLRPYLQWTTRCHNNINPEQQQSSMTSSSSAAKIQQSMKSAVGVTAQDQEQIQRKCLHSHKHDDIQGVLLEQFGINTMYLDRSLFIKHVKAEARVFQPPGKVISEFERQVKVTVSEKLDESLFPNAFYRPNRPKRQVQDGFETKTFRVYKVQVVQGNFKDNNRHLQALLKFYIEGASFIIVDQLWYYFLVYMDTKLVAYTTAYEEFRKIPKAAATISQVLVLPPYQGMGIGSTLLNLLYQHYLGDRKCQLITVEDPALDFQRIKDCLDTKLILQAGFFRQAKRALLTQVKRSRRKQPYLQAESLRECTLDHVEIGQIRAKLKLAKNNIQRCFEFVLMALLDPKDHVAHDTYRKGVLKRMAECRDLLRPYFIYDQFADRSLYSNMGGSGPTDELQRDADMNAMRENRCMADGLLTCLAQQDQADIVMRESTAPDQKDTGDNQANNNNKDSSQKMNAEKSPARKRGSLSPSPTEVPNAPKLRPNRFTTTPWNEVQNPAQAVYELPASLAAKVTLAIKEYWLQ